MNYRHAFHAGNHADLLKHALLDAALRRLGRKAKPMVVIDLFAGTGLYDLRLDERADRTGEWRAGVSRLWDARESERGGPLGPYLERLEIWNASEPALRWHPGSPLLALAAFRADDKLLAVEKHPEEHAALVTRLAGDPRARAYAEDAWAALRSFLPPTPRRGLVIIDPPFEAPGEFDRLALALKDGLRRWATGVFLLWHPIKSAFDAEGWAAQLRAASGETPLLETALRVAPEGDPGLIGSGMIIANPPYGFAEDAAQIVARLAALLAAETAEGARFRWLREPV